MAREYEVVLFTTGSSRFLDDLAVTGDRVGAGAAWYATQLHRWDMIFPAMGRAQRTQSGGEVMVVINAVLLTALTGGDRAREYRPVFQEGRTRWYSIADPELRKRIESCLRFPRRSNVERRVNERNGQVWNWLNELREVDRG